MSAPTYDPGPSPAFLERGGHGPAPAAGEDRRAWIQGLLEQVVDPEIPVLTIADMGILKGVDLAPDGAVTVRITPTYSGCPAMDMIAAEVRRTLADAGIESVTVDQVLSPAWTTDWMTDEGREKLRAYGIAPPAKGAGKRSLMGMDDPEVACPQCGSTQTEKVSEFGSTACKALWRCTACLEPFDYFKCI